MVLLFKSFVVLNKSLEATVSLAGVRNEQTLSMIFRKVDKNKNRPGDVKILVEATELRKRTKTMLQYMVKVKMELVERTGWLGEEGEFLGAKQEEPVMHNIC